MTTPDDPATATQYVAASLLRQGIALAQQGERDRAQDALRRVIQLDPEQEEAWLWLAWTAQSREESRRYLLEARAILPGSVRIAEAFRWAADLTADVPAERAREEEARRTGVGAADRRERAVSPGAAAAKAALDATRGVSSGVAAGWDVLQRTGRRAAARAKGIRIPHPSWQQVRARAGVILAAVLVIGLVSLALHAISRESRIRDSVLAEELPPQRSAAGPAAETQRRTESLRAEADAAFLAGDWESAIEALRRVLDLAPRDEQSRKQLAVAHFNVARDLLQQNRLQEARLHFDWAIRADASDPQLQEERRILSLYLGGLDAYVMQDWRTAVRRLSKVYEIYPEYHDTHTMLGEAHYQLGLELQAQRKWFQARDEMEACLELLPEHREAPARIVEIDEAITPPRRVEVSLSQFTVTLYENNQPVRVFTICHGREGSPTLPGRYEVQSKLPVAYGAQWDIDMPHWLGIYETGGIENGFHGLPILRNGARLWTQALGTRCSFGCIVLDIPDAEYLWNWADIGTVVFIRE